jgi:hypothetical protein
MTAWIPFLDADVRNGCMQVLRGGHRVGRVVPHLGCSGQTWYIETDQREIEPTLGLSILSHTVTTPVPFGSVLLLNNLIPHRSLNNASDRIRWSVDVRWQKSQEPSGFPAKPLLPLSRAGEPTFKPDWSLWADQDRHVLVKAQLAGKTPQEAPQPTDPFDTTIVRAPATSIQLEDSAAHSPPH